jgi:hypothetical protein
VWSSIQQKEPGGWRSMLVMTQKSTPSWVEGRSRLSTGTARGKAFTTEDTEDLFDSSSA